MPYSWIGLSHRRIFLFARHRSSSFFSLIYCFFSARDGEDLLQIWRLAKVSTPETSYAFHPVRHKSISVCEPSYDKPSALDKPALTHDLARCRWQTLDGSHPGSNTVLVTGVSCMIDRVGGAVASRVKSYPRRHPKSLPASPCNIIPEQTMQVARAVFPKGNPYIRRRDALGP